MTLISHYIPHRLQHWPELFLLRLRRQQWPESLAESHHPLHPASNSHMLQPYLSNATSVSLYRWKLGLQFSKFHLGYVLFFVLIHNADTDCRRMTGGCKSVVRVKLSIQVLFEVLRGMILIQEKPWDRNGYCFMCVAYGSTVQGTNDIFCF